MEGRACVGITLWLELPLTIAPSPGQVTWHSSFAAATLPAEAQQVEGSRTSNAAALMVLTCFTTYFGVFGQTHHPGHRNALGQSVFTARE